MKVAALEFHIQVLTYQNIN